MLGAGLLGFVIVSDARADGGRELFVDGRESGRLDVERAGVEGDAVEAVLGGVVCWKPEDCELRFRLKIPGMTDRWNGATGGRG